MKLTSLLPWFGSKRTMAPEIVNQLGKHSYYFEGCCGSMAVLFAKEPSEHEVVCDLHGAMTNLAWIVREWPAAEQLFERLQRVMYSDELYAASKEWLAENDGKELDGPAAPGLQKIAGDDFEASIEWAYHYFIASWMGRNGVSGTARVNYQIATRWTKGGGSGPLRFRNAVDSIPDWCERLKNVHILRRDMFDIIPKIEDDDGVSVYVDPPYLPGTISGNSKYLHGFDEAVNFDHGAGDIRKVTKHELLAKQLCRFRKARVVVSYYADPQLQSLYPGWSVMDCSRHKHLHVQNKRGGSRKDAPEVLLVNGELAPEYVKPKQARKKQEARLF